MELIFQLDGYRDASALVSRIEAQTGRFKVSPIPLTPKSWAVTLARSWRQHPLLWMTGLALLVLAGVVGVRQALAVRRELARGQYLKKLQAKASPQTLVGEVLAGYRLIDVLGRGGFAIVYRAIPDSTLDESQAVAVKVLHDKSQDTAARLKREIQVVRTLTHPNIVELRDYGEQDGLWYLVYELIEGVTLRSVIPDEGMSVARAWNILEPLLQAVEYAHQSEHQVVHRDLKPDNVMLTKQGRVKVLDFGLARSQTSVTLTESGSGIGTPRYMAPEQFGGARGPGVDQYALGVIAYELLTGASPIDTDDFLQLMAEVMNPDPLPKPCRPLPPEIEAVLMRMLEKNPLRRYADVSEALAAWRQALSADELVRA